MAVDAARAAPERTVTLVGQGPADTDLSVDAVQVHAIKALASANEDFRSLCADLAEAAAVRWEHSLSPVSGARSAEYREMAKDLAAELKRRWIVARNNFELGHGDSCCHIGSEHMLLDLAYAVLGAMVAPLGPALRLHL